MAFLKGVIDNAGRSTKQHKCKAQNNYLRGVMLVLLSENVFVDIKLLTAVDHPPNPGDTSFEEPKELVQVVSGNIQRSGRDENGVVVTSLK